MADNDAVLVMLDTVRGELIEEMKALALLMTEPLADVQLDALAKISKQLTENTAQTRDLVAQVEKTCDTLVRRLDEPVMPGLQGSIEDIIQTLHAEKQPPVLDWRRLAGIGVGIALLSGVLGWWIGATPLAQRQQARLMEQVHGVLVERYQTLPPELKTRLTTVYNKQGFLLEAPRGGKP